MLVATFLALALPLLVDARPASDMRGLHRRANGTHAHRRRACGPKTGNGTTTTPIGIAVNHALPSEGIRGVNVGSWFLIEPYMMIDEWKNMGGEWCGGGCHNCVGTEFDLVQKLGQQKANDVFAKHWTSFITQDDVDLMKSYNLNSVRIPIGFWIIESTVNQDEHYPQGGLDHLRNACKMFKDAGISVLLDMHAAPGASTASNAFAGRCVSTPGFWNQANFDRHNKAAAELTRLVHSEPENFGSVWGIEALNEPPMDGNQTPGYYKFMQDFVAAVRNTEKSLSIGETDQISTVFMDVSWQYKNNAGNPAYVANGGNAYDSHTYFSFGAPCGPQGCAKDTLDSHVQFACSGDGGKIQQDAAQHNRPSFLGEYWLLPTKSSVFNNFDKDKIRRFADAQRRGYAPEGGNGGYGSYFWSWKMTNSDSDGTNHMRSYRDAVEQGYIPKDAATYYNPTVCG